MFITLSTLSLGVATFEDNKLSFSQDTIYAAVKNGYENGIYYQNSQKANGYLNDGTHWYLFKDGVKQSGVQKWAGTYYYFDPNTYLRTDNAFREQWGNTYYFGSNGDILTGMQKINGTYYFFGNDGYLYSAKRSVCIVLG